MKQFHHDQTERHQAIATLSRGHYVGQVQVLPIEKAADPDDVARRKAIARRNTTMVVSESARARPVHLVEATIQGVAAIISRLFTPVLANMQPAFELSDRQGEV
jgi:hypothetical protein